MSEVNLEFKKHQIQPYMGEKHPRAFWQTYKKPIARPLPAPPVAIQEVAAPIQPKSYVSLASAIMSLDDGERTKSFTVDAIKRAVSEITGITIAEMTSDARFRRIVIARQLAISLCVEFTTHSLSRVGTFFGGKDHSTIIHAVRRANGDQAPRLAAPRAHVLALLEQWKK